MSGEDIYSQAIQVFNQIYSGRKYFSSKIEICITKIDSNLICILSIDKPQNCVHKMTNRRQ